MQGRRTMRSLEGGANGLVRCWRCCCCCHLSSHTLYCRSCRTALSSVVAATYPSRVTSALRPFFAQSDQLLSLSFLSPSMASEVCTTFSAWLLDVECVDCCLSLACLVPVSLLFSPARSLTMLRSCSAVAWQASPCRASRTKPGAALSWVRHRSLHSTPAAGFTTSHARTHHSLTLSLSSTRCDVRSPRQWHCCCDGIAVRSAPSAGSSQPAVLHYAPHRSHRRIPVCLHLRMARSSAGGQSREAVPAVTAGGDVRGQHLCVRVAAHQPRSRQRSRATGSGREEEMTYTPRCLTHLQPYQRMIGNKHASSTRQRSTVCGLLYVKLTRPACRPPCHRSAPPAA